MKVAFVARYGPPEVAEIREVPAPSPGAGEVRIRVLATAVTAGDWRIRSGVLPRGFGVMRGPALGFGGPRKGVLGTDAAGLVDAVGTGVTRFQVGDPVLAFPGVPRRCHGRPCGVSRDPRGWVRGAQARKPHFRGGGGASFRGHDRARFFPTR